MTDRSVTNLYSKKEIFKQVVMENTDYDKGITVNELKSILDSMNANISRASIYNYVNRSIEEGIIEKRGNNIFYVGEKLLNNHEARFIADAILSSRILTKKKTQLLLEKISKICGKNAFKNILENYDEFCNYQPSPKATNEEVFMFYPTSFLQNQIITKSVLSTNITMCIKN